MLRADNISYTYPASSLSALTSCSLEVASGEVVAVCGGRAAGKTTLAHILSGTLDPDAGSVSFGAREDFSHEVTLIDGDDVFGCADDLVAEEVAHRLGERGIVDPVLGRRVRDALSLTGISHLADAKVQTLSGIEVLLLMLSCLVAVRPRYAIVDGMDALLVPGLSDVFCGVLDELRTRGTHVVLMTRRLAGACVADACVVLSEGKVVWSGDPQELCDRDDFLDAGHIGTEERMAFREPWSMPSVGASATVQEETIAQGFACKGIKLRRQGVSVLAGVDVVAPAGHITLVSGRFGAGKTSLALTASGYLVPDGGDVSLGRARMRRGMVGFVPEACEDRFIFERVEDELRNVVLSGSEIGDEVPERMRKALDAVTLSQDLLERDVKECSYGERQLLALASVVASDARAVVLDEPCATLDGLDAEHVRTLAKRLTEDGRAVIVVSRDPLPWLPYVDACVFLHEGAVAFAGTRDECISSPAPWVAAQLPVPGWLFQVRGPQGTSRASGATRRSLDDLSSIVPPVAAGNASKVTAELSGSLRGPDGLRADSGASRRVRMLRARAVRPAYLEDGKRRVRASQVALIVAFALTLASFLIPAMSFLPILTVLVVLFCSVCRMGVRDVARVLLVLSPLSAFVLLVGTCGWGQMTAAGTLAGCCAALRLWLVVLPWVACARVSTPSDVAGVLSAPLAPFSTVGVDVDARRDRLSTHLRRIALYVGQLHHVWVWRSMREAPRKGLTWGKHAITVAQLRACARRRVACRVETMDNIMRGAEDGTKGGRNG